MRHQHTWHTTACLLLSLPTVDHYAERFMSWACACGAYATVYGDIAIGHPVSVPEYWTRLFSEEQASGTPHARMAYAQQQGRKT